MVSRSRICPRPVRATVTALLSVLLLIQTTGCTSWHTAKQPVPEAVAKHSRGSLRLELTDGRVFIADSVRVIDDSLLVLLPNWTLQQVGRGSTVSDTIPLALVATVRTRALSIGKTLGLFAVVVVFLGGVAVLAECTSPPESFIDLCPFR